MQTSRPWLIGFLIVAFVAARLTGAHLHMCFDGSEPLAQLHVSDTAGVDHHSDTLGHDAADLGHHVVEVDHHSLATDSHEDVDVDVLGNLLAKVAKLDLPALALVAWCLALLYVAVFRQPIRARLFHPPLPLPRFLRPLLRAPPA
jgi:hypothetical protein